MYKGIVVFMVVGLKQSIIPFVVQAIPEVKLSDIYIYKISDNIDSLIEIGICVRRIVTDNHLANVNAFSALIKMILQ